MSVNDHSKRVEHGSNSLLNSLATFATHYPFYSPPLPKKGGFASAVPKRRVEHGSSSLLRMLMGHTGSPSEDVQGPHPNTLLYHATTGQDSATSPSNARKAAVARGRAIKGAAGEQMKRGIQKQVSSWFWPLDALF